MAAPQQKPRIVPGSEPEYDPVVGEPLPPTFPVSEQAQPSDSSTGLIIAALVVVLGILFVLSFDWSGTSTTPAVTQDNAAPATPDPLAPAPATPPSAEAPTPPATEPPATTAQ